MLASLHKCRPPTTNDEQCIQVHFSTHHQHTADTNRQTHTNRESGHWTHFYHVVQWSVVTVDIKKVSSLGLCVSGTVVKDTKMCV